MKAVQGTAAMLAVGLMALGAWAQGGQPASRPGQPQGQSGGMQGGMAGHGMMGQMGQGMSGQGAMSRDQMMGRMMTEHQEMMHLMSRMRAEMRAMERASTPDIRRKDMQNMRHLMDEMHAAVMRQGRTMRMYRRQAPESKPPGSPPSR